MKWTKLHDIYLCREVLAVEPFQFKPGSKQAGNAWQMVAEDLNLNTQKVLFCVTKQSVKDHLKLLITKHKSATHKEENASGSSPEECELKKALDEIIAKFAVAKETYKHQSQEAQDTINVDKQKAIEIRQTAMERLGETKKRKDEMGEVSTSRPKKQRTTGSETISYLREKNQTEMELRREELEVKKAELQQQKTLLEQHNDMQQQILQQQREQNQCMFALVEKLIEKR